MAVYQWLLRCVPGLAILLLFVLIELSLGIGRSLYFYLYHDHPQRLLLDPVVPQFLFCVYALALHLLAFSFPFRLSRAARTATNAIQEYHARDVAPLTDNERSVIMVVILPAYKETLDTMRETLDVLASHSDASASYDVFLAMEERDPDALATAKQLTLEYSASFRDMQTSFHPAGIPGESAGKSSNVSWAASEVMIKYSSDADVLVTVMDSDSHLQQQYFRYIRERHVALRQEDPHSNDVLYVPPIVFDRNAHEIPLLVRAADLMWSGAGLSCYAKAAPKDHLAIPTSVYTLSLPLVHLANGWDAGADAIGEDMHMMLKCYFASKGLLKIDSIPSPVSQCNIDTPVRGIRGYLDHHRVRYKQALRHMWGCLDTGYALKNWVELNRTDAAHQPMTPSASPTIAPRVPRRPRKLSHSSKPLKWQIIEPRRFTIRNACLFLRMIEAHCLPAHLPLIVMGSALYMALPRPTTEWLWLPMCFDILGYLRLAGFVSMMCYFLFVYESYHATCLRVRELEMTRAQLADNVSFSRRRKWHPRSIIDFIIFPVAGTLYGAVPLIQAALTHFWTMDLVYLVSAKPARASTKTTGTVTSETTIGGGVTDRAGFVTLVDNTGDENENNVRQAV